MSDREFEEVFDHAARRIHNSMPRGEQPSASVWNAVKGNTSRPTNPMIEAKPATNQPVHVRRSRLGSSVIDPNKYSQPDYLRWTSWLVVIALVGAIGFGFYSINQDEPGNRQQSIAMAPSTPELGDSVHEAPAASPLAQDYDPAFACNVEPLTEEEVYRIVINPYTGWYYNEHPDGTPNPDHAEWTDYWLFYYSEYEAISGFVPVDDPEVAGPVMELANTFWNCLMTGSALQVWSLMTPTLVQHDILYTYPVMRDEATLRAHIAEWGPRRFNDGRHSHLYPDLGTPVPGDASNHVDAIRMGYNAQGNPWKAAVRIIHNPYDGTELLVNDLLIERSPDGTRWLVSAYLQGN